MSELKNENIDLEFGETLNIGQQDTCECEDCDCGESIPDCEELLNLLAVQEEEKRIENFEKDFEPSQMTKNTDLFREGFITAQTIVAMTKEMVNAGIDYNNALVATLNFITSKQNLELARVQQIQAQQSQI